MSKPTRVQPGVPTGGQFTAQPRLEADAALPVTDPGSSEYALEQHDEHTALCLAIERVRQRHSVLANQRWHDDRYEDMSRADAISSMSLAPESAAENAQQAGDDIDDPSTMQAYVLGLLDGNPFEAQVLDELDRIKGNPPKRRALRQVEGEIADLRDQLDDAEAEAVRAQADEHCPPGDRDYFRREADTARQRLRYAQADADELRSLDPS